MKFYIYLQNFQTHIQKNGIICIEGSLKRYQQLSSWIKTN